MSRFLFEVLCCYWMSIFPSGSIKYLSVYLIHICGLQKLLTLHPADRAGTKCSPTHISSLSLLSSAFSNQEVFHQVTDGYRMPAPPKCPNFLYQIMLKCWSAEPDDRPDFKSLKVQLDSSSYELEWRLHQPAVQTPHHRGAAERDTDRWGLVSRN